MVRALALHQCGPDSIPAWCHMWLDRWRGGESASLTPMWPGFDSDPVSHHGGLIEFVVDERRTHMDGTYILYTTYI